MTAVLGISAFYHDSAAALLIDGRIIAAAQEERFSRVKHDARFPAQAIAWCLAESRLTPNELDYIAFYDKPLMKFERLLETFLCFAPAGFRSFASAMPLWLKDKLWTRRTIRQGIGSCRAPLVFLEHHESHAASAFFPSPYERAAILTVDGVGEWGTATMGTGVGNQIHLTHQLNFPHSLGLLYSAFTYYCGFKVNSGEYKLMGLAPFGKPVYADVIKERLIDLRSDGSLWLDMDYFRYCHGLTMTSGRFHRLFGGPPRTPESPIDQRHKDLAASIQAVTEEALLKMATHLHRDSGMKNLVLAGGVALNCVANGRLLREGPFDSIWVQPAAGDAGGALGAAWFVWHQLLKNPREPNPADSQQGSLLGPAYSTADVSSFLERNGIRHERTWNEDELCRSTAELIAQGKVVGWFQGRMEFGPRALGARSILADPRSPTMQATLNQRIKRRESFRPFAPAVLRDHAADWFQWDPRHESPYMSFVAPVQHACSPIPAVTHVDHSARLQTVDGERNPRFHRLLQAFYALTGCPVLINTSFNVRGEPIVCTPEDAYRCFLATDMDVLVMADCQLFKEQVTRTSATERKKRQFQYQFD